MRMQLKLGTHQEGVGWDCCRGADRCVPHRVCLSASAVSLGLTQSCQHLSHPSVIIHALHIALSPPYAASLQGNLPQASQSGSDTAPQRGCCLLAWRACVWILRLGRRMELMGCRDVGDRHCPVAAQQITSALSFLHLHRKVRSACEGSVRSPL